MAVGGRADTRQRFLRRMLMIAVVLVIFALILFASGHWILGIIIGVMAAAAVWLLLQTRTVR